MANAGVTCIASAAARRRARRRITQRGAPVKMPSLRRRADSRCLVVALCMFASRRGAADRVDATRPGGPPLRGCPARR